MSNQRIPVTMLSGFLGAGKTTLLRELLTQSKYKIGCIVNDVAAVNIDAKLVRNQQGQGDASVSTSDLAPTIELQNGCACCSVQDELFLSFEQILSVGARNGVTYDRIVLENSGVAEPQNIRDAFSDAEENRHPVMKKIKLSTMITVVDSHTFIKEYACRNPVSTRPDLGGDESSLRPVVDLLVEQIEVADYVVLNKVDMLTDGQLPELENIAKSINPLCEVMTCSHGKVDMDKLFGPDAKALLSALNTEGQHRGYIAASREAQSKANGHDHDYSDHHHHHHHHDDGEDCSGCKAGDHDHSHHHHHHHHHHDHDGADSADCAACKHGHDHDHKHNHQHKATTAETRFGIKSFVYSRRRPFHPQRLKDTVLKWMPVADNKVTGSAAPSDNTSPIKTVLRSKGFMWLSHGHTTAFYWSHAGQHFEIREEGDWWVAVPDEEWPTQQEQRDIILSDFEAKNGDRRQEIVFIGVGMDQAAIEAALDKALLTDEELGKYEENWAKLPDPVHEGAPK